MKIENVKLGSDLVAAMESLRDMAALLAAGDRFDGTLWIQSRGKRRVVWPSKKMASGLLDLIQEECHRIEKEIKDL
jgi:hypothetical protein